jgi:hypothetical protein
LNADFIYALGDYQARLLNSLHRWQYFILATSVAR